MRFLVFLSGTFLGAALLCSPADAADPPENDDFPTLVKRGDSARLTGDWLAAVDAYRAALDLRDDPLLAGRLGLVLLTLRAFDAAAGNLLHAVELSAGSSDAERQRFWSAYQVAQREVCRINISIDQKNVILSVDGESRPTKKSDFWLFLTRGKHTLRVSREGFEDETKEIVAKGVQMEVVFTMRPIQKPATIAASVESLHAEPIPLPIDKPAPETNPPPGQFVLGVGGAFVFGATPTPAFGPLIHGAWRSRSWWEIGVDLRAAWTFVHDNRFPDTRFVTWSVTAAPCGRARSSWFVCGLVQLDGMTNEASLRLGVMPGFGVRGGIEFVIKAPLRVQLWADGTVHPGGMEFVGEPPWRGSIFTGTLGARAIYAF